MAGLGEVDGLLERLLVLVSAHTALAGPAIGALAFTESLIVIGMFVPAFALMIGVGGLMATGVLDPAPVLFWAVLGSVLGDWLSYLLGRRIGPSIYRRWPLSSHRQETAFARLFFRRYGFVSVLLGRFFGPVRATVPLVAGVIGMNHRSFQAANVLSAVVWVPAMLAPGYLAGANLSLEAITNTQALGIGLGLILVPFLIATAIAHFAMSRRSGRKARRKTGAFQVPYAR